MRRVVSVLLASILLLAALATPVAAQTPIDERRVREDVPLGAFDFTLPAGDFCDFPLLIEDIAGDITFVFITEDRHGNVLERVIFHTVARYTNTVTGDSFEERFDSVGNSLFRADGTFRIIARNDVLAWYVEGDPSELGPGVWLIDHGRIVEEYDAEGNLVSARVDEADEILDVCAALS